MKLPFTVQQFFEVLARYNDSIYPMQVMLYLLAIAALFFLIVKTSNSNRIIGIILAVLFGWNGGVYHLGFFTAINKAAYIFGALFLIQFLMFLFISGFKDKLSFKFKSNLYGWMGIIFIIYALLIYPVFLKMTGHNYPQTPTFGLPCPTIIFTFGMLLLTDKKIPKYILIVPFLWSLIGFSAAVKLTVTPDYGLGIIGVLGTVLILFRDRKLKSSKEQE